MEQAWPPLLHRAGDQVTRWQGLDSPPSHPAPHRLLHQPLSPQNLSPAAVTTPASKPRHESKELPSLYLNTEPYTGGRSTQHGWCCESRTLLLHAATAWLHTRDCFWRTVQTCLVAGGPASSVDTVDLFPAVCHTPDTLTLPNKGLSSGCQSSNPDEPCHGVSPPLGSGF